MINVLTSNEQSDLFIDPNQIAPLVRAVIAFEGKSTKEVSIRLVNSATICALHDQFFNDPSLTDCISFPIDDEVLGDVVVCPKIALEYDDPYEETTLYIVHGLLHLMGYDDIEEIDRLKMKEREAAHLNHLRKKKLILHQP